MNLIPHIDREGEWLRGGASQTIVLSTRVRLARNLTGRKFPAHADPSDRRTVLDEIRYALLDCPSGKSLRWFNLNDIEPLDRSILVERHIISRELADASGERAVAFDGDESLALMVNEEDHVRLQCLKAGFRLREAFDWVDRLDDELGERLEFAFDERYGYLTSCPTNVGTGLRVSVMVHLPALVMTQHAEKAFRAVHELRLAVRGFYGEGTEALGELYQISNQVTCGRSEETIISDLEAVIESLVQYEEKARARLLTQSLNQLEDRIWRSVGALRNARLMTSEEAMRHISSLRLGVATGLVKKPAMQELNRLFLFSQPAHLQRIEGKELASEARDSARAAFLRRHVPGDVN